MIYDFLSNEFGDIFVIIENDKLVQIVMSKEEFEDLLYLNKDMVRDTKKARFVTKELEEYFKRERKKFTIPYEINVSGFDKKVLEEVAKIPYGKVLSYKDIAVILDNSNASRAVGNANRKNKLPIIIPCHRVIKSDGSVGGYAGKEGNETKIKLLKLEGCEKFD